MATWKKVIVSGSSAELGALFVTGAVTGSVFSGSFTGDGSNLTGVSAQVEQSLLFGNGLDGGTFTGQTGVTASINLDGATLTVGASGLKVSDTGIDTAQLADNSVTAAKLDDVFSDTPGAFGSSTAVPVITVDGQGRILSASTATISTTIAISGSTSGNDSVSLINDALTFTGANGLTATVTDNTVTFGAGGALFSGSAQVSLGGDLSGDASNATVAKVQGVDLTSGEATQLANIDSTTISATQWGYLGAADQSIATTDNVTFATASISQNLTVGGDLIVSGDTISANVTNLNVEDQFILLNSGSAAADGGFVIDGAGSALGWDQSAGRWALDFAGATWNQTSITSDAYVASVITGDDSNYDKVGNIKVASGEIYIYV